MKGFGNLCPPAMVYLIVSIFFLFIVYIQNYYNNNVYCLGSFSCDSDNVWLIFAMKIIYILVWTFILNVVCKMGMPYLSWVLVFVPFILAFLIVGSMMAFH